MDKNYGSLIHENQWSNRKQIRISYRQIYTISESIRYYYGGYTEYITEGIRRYMVAILSYIHP